MDQQLAENMLTVSLLVTFLLEQVKPLLHSLPFVANLRDDAYSAFMRVLGYVANFGLLIALLASQGTLDFGHQWYAYLAAALGQQIVSHTGYKVMSSGSASAAPVAGEDSGVDVTTNGQTEAPAQQQETPTAGAADPDQTAAAVAGAVSAQLAQG